MSGAARYTGPTDTPNSAMSSRPHEGDDESVYEHCARGASHSSLRTLVVAPFVVGVTLALGMSCGAWRAVRPHTACAVCRNNHMMFDGDCGG